MQVLDISDPTAPRKIANVPQTGSTRIQIGENLAYLDSGGTASLVDISNLDDPLGLGYIDFNSNFDLAVAVHHRIYILNLVPGIEVFDYVPASRPPRTVSKTTITSSANPSVSGQTVSFTVQVSQVPDWGTVQLQDNGTNLGARLTPNSSGRATYAAPGLLVGVHTITAVYSGDVNFISSTGSFKQTVNGNAPATSTTGRPRPTMTENIITFPDLNLESAVRLTVNEPTGDIYQSDLLKLTSLAADGAGIVNLSGIQYCTNLNFLDLAGNRISNISYLANLVNLQSLQLARNQITNISAVSNLVKLEYLGLYSNQVSDISPLSNLSTLEVLVAFDNKISDISAVAHLTNLGNVDLSQNEITDISPLTRNMGFHIYGYVYITDNYLNTEAGSMSMTDIQTLTDRHMYVIYQPQNVGPILK
jgi:hypothetical protein